MALNREVFKTRALSAILFALVMLAGILLHPWSFFLLFSVIHFGCWVEFQRLITRIDPEYADISAFHRYGVMVAGWCFMLNFTHNDFMLGNIALHEIGWWIGLLLCFLLPVTELLLAGHIRAKNLWYSALGLVYISLSLSLLVDIYSSNFPVPSTNNPSTGSTGFLSGFRLPLLIIGCIWITDTMAYISGSLFGKTPLSSISPKKTWEGTIGGIVLAVAAVSLTMYFLLPGSMLLFWIGFALVVAVSGTIGDLFESKLKRMAGVKDSGNLMPGHGGFLDRFDSLLIAIPLVWIFLKSIQ